MEALYRITYYARSESDYSKIIAFGDFTSEVTSATAEYLYNTCLPTWESVCKKQLDGSGTGDYCLDMQVVRLV